MKLDNIIVLHRDEDNAIIVIDIDKISSMYVAIDKTTIIYIDNSVVCVKEDIATVMKRIKNHRGD